MSADVNTLVYIPLGFIVAERSSGNDVLGLRTHVISCSSNEGFQSFVQLASLLPVDSDKEEDKVVRCAVAALKEHHKSTA